MWRAFLACVVLALVLAPAAFAQQTDYDRALTAYLKKDFRSAVAILKGYVATAPEAKAYYLLGYASYALKQHKEASEYFTQAYLIEPDFKPESVESEFKQLRP